MGVREAARLRVTCRENFSCREDAERSSRHAMKTYLHSTLERSYREGDRVVFVRRAVIKPLMLAGIALLLLGLGVVSRWVSESSAQEIRWTGVLLFLVFVVFAASPGTERVEIDVALRQVTTAVGAKIPFSSIRSLEIQQTTDSEDSPAYRLRFTTAEGPKPLSRTFCWSEDAVRAVALQIVGEIPGLSFSPSPVVSDD